MPDFITNNLYYVGLALITGGTFVIPVARKVWFMIFKALLKKMLTEKFAKRVIFTLLDKLVASTKTKFDNDVLAEVKKLIG